MPKYVDACRTRIITDARNINASDFKVVVTAVAASGNYNVTVTITPFNAKGDVAAITQCTGASIFNNELAGSASIIVSGVQTTGAPNALTVVFNGVPAPTTTNKWKAVFNNLIVRGKAGNTVTVPSLTVPFTSPV